MTELTPRFSASKLYKSPDGEDCLEKTTETTLKAFKIGTAWGLAEMIGTSRPQGIGAKVTRYVYWVTPAVLMGATFAATGCLLGRLRGKDDFINHALAGAASASFLGIRYGVGTGLRFALPLSVAAGVYKYAKTCGVEFFADDKPIVHENGSFHHYDRHFGPRTVVKEPTNY